MRCVFCGVKDRKWRSIVEYCNHLYQNPECRKAYEAQPKDDLIVRSIRDCVLNERERKE